MPHDTCEDCVSATAVLSWQASRSLAVKQQRTERDIRGCVQADCKAHYFSVYVASPAFPEPAPAPEMAGVNPMQVAPSDFPELSMGETGAVERGVAAEVEFLLCDARSWMALPY